MTESIETDNDGLDEETVKTFLPCDKVKEQTPDVRAAGETLIAEGKTIEPERKTFIYVNSKLETRWKQSAPCSTGRLDLMASPSV